MTIHPANLPDSLAAGFRQIFIDALKFGEKPPVMGRVFNTPPTPATAYVDDSYVTGFGLVPKKTMGAPSEYDDFYQGFDKRYTHETYSLIYRIIKEWAEDERYNLMQKLPRALGRSMRATVETDGANMFNNGFDSNYVGADGVELFSLLHPLIGGGTQKNELTTAADLADTSYEQALIDIAETTDDQGIPMELIPKKLYYPHNLEWTVRVLFKSGKDPDTANNAYNPAQDFKLEFINGQTYLTDEDAWFIICDTHEGNWFWRVMPDHYRGNDFDTDDLKYKIRARWIRGWSVPWGLFGTAGAA